MRVLLPAPGSDECGTCRFVASYSDDQSVGQCRISRPTMGSQTAEAMWPVVQVTDFCGEYERRYVVEAQPPCPVDAHGAV